MSKSASSFYITGPHLFRGTLRRCTYAVPERERKRKRRERGAGAVREGSRCPSTCGIRSFRPFNTTFNSAFLALRGRDKQLDTHRDKSDPPARIRLVRHLLLGPAVPAYSGLCTESPGSKSSFHAPCTRAACAKAEEKSG